MCSCTRKSGTITTARNANGTLLCIHESVQTVWILGTVCMCFFFSLFRKANGDWSEIAVNMILLYDERKLDNCANSFSMLHFNVFIYYLWSFKWEYLLVMDKYLSALLLSVNIYFGTVDADDIVDVVAKARKMLICWVSIWSLSPPLFGQSRSDSLLFAVYVRLCVCVPLVVVAVVVYCHCHCRPCIANVHFALVGNV